MLRYNKLKDRPRDFLAVTSLTLEEFQQFAPAHITVDTCGKKFFPTPFLSTV